MGAWGLFADSFSARVVHGSRLVLWWNARPEPGTLFETSRIFRAGKGLERVGWAVFGMLAGGALMAAPDSRGIVVTLVLLALLAYSMPEPALAALPFSFIWSPKLPLVGLANETVFVRADHALAVGLCLYLLVRGRSRLKESALYGPLFLFLAVATLSIVAGMVRGSVQAPSLSVLYLFQNLQCAGVFIAAYSLGPRLGRAGLYVWALALISAAAYGLCEYFVPLQSTLGYRTFERGTFIGQANHFAGLFAFGTVVGAALLAEPRWRVLGGTLALLCAGAMVGTGSREGLAALGAGLATLLALRSRAAGGVIAAAGLLFAALAPPEFWYRLSEPGSSLFARFIAWKSALSTFWDRPLLGLGMGARHRSYYDNHYIFLLAETGAAGLGCFIAWLAGLARALRWESRQTGPGRVLALGALAGLAGVMVQGMAASTFHITVIAGPIYWFAGYALGMRESRA